MTKIQEAIIFKMQNEIDAITSFLENSEFEKSTKSTWVLNEMFELLQESIKEEV